MKNLDEIIQSSEASVIALEPGQYFTQGNPLNGTFRNVLPKGVKLIGKCANPSETVIKLIRHEPFSHNVIAGAGRNIIENLTIDCGEPDSLKATKINGIALEGEDNIIENVTILRPSGWYNAHKESFGIIIRSGHVQNVLIHTGDGDYVSAIVFTGEGSADKVSCLFEPGEGKETQGLTVAGGKNVTFTSCLVVNAKRGFYTDDGDLSNVHVAGSKLLNVLEGVSINAQAVPSSTRILKDLEFRNNLIRLRQGGTGLLIRNRSEAPSPETWTMVRDVVFSDNNLDGPAGSYLANLASSFVPGGTAPCPGICNVTIKGNQINSPGWQARNAAGNSVDNLEHDLPFSWIQ